MYKKIAEIRQRPENERRRITILSALGITLIITFLWGFINFGIEKDKGDESLATGEYDDSDFVIASPFQSLKSQFNELLHAISFNEIKEGAKSQFADLKDLSQRFKDLEDSPE